MFGYKSEKEIIKEELKDLKLKKQKLALENIEYKKTNKDLIIQNEINEKKIKQLENQITNNQDYLSDLCSEHNIRHPNKTLINTAITQKEKISFSNEIQTDFLERLKNIGIELNEEQQKVLFSEDPAVCVGAGAGSGKSTTLVCRIALLHIVKGVELKKLTVTTFTVESRLDFIKKLVKVLNNLTRIPNYIDEERAKKVVRTFHSLAYHAHHKFGDGKKIIFGEKTPKFEDDEGNPADLEDLENMSTQQLIKKYGIDDSIEPLSKYLNESYKTLYSDSNSNFKNLIDQLYIISFNQYNEKNDKYPDNKEYSSQHEDEISSLSINDWIQENEDSYYSSNLNSYRENGSVLIKETNINYHFYFPETNTYVFASNHPKNYDDKKSIKNKNKKISSIMYQRRKFLYHYSSINYIWIHDLADINRILFHENSQIKNNKGDTLSPPNFAYKCVGEIVNTSPSSKNFSPIYHHLNQLSSFIHSVGCNIEDIDENNLKHFFGEITKFDEMFLKSAKLYYSSLKKTLSENNLTTFDYIFYEFGQNKTSLEGALEADLIWCEHILIDEFQDISPVIANFLINLKSIYYKLTGRGTLMFVGDKNQAIYSWRGSSKLFISKPDLKFKTHHDFIKLPLNSNYRSAKKIISKSQKCISFLGSKEQLIPKHPDANSMQSLFELFRPVPDPKNNKKTIIDYDRLSEKLEDEIVSTNPTELSPIYIISAKNRYITGPEGKGTGHKEWDNLLKKHTLNKKIKCLTIHRSKGLESKSVFLLGDIVIPDENPLKNAIYNWADVGTPFKMIQSDEAYCLGYVAITRAKNNFYWFLDKISIEGVSNLYKNDIV
tara:strand:- start:65561 stop:68053 length:2493 start_codon:yes stop_codon:yes gene_type:complete